MIKRTDWYHHHQKPVHTGVYERRYGFNVVYCWYCAVHRLFSVARLSSEAAMESSVDFSEHQNLPWRGVVK